MQPLCLIIFGTKPKLTWIWKMSTITIQAKDVYFRFQRYQSFSSVTRFGKISPPYAKTKMSGNFMKVNLVFGKNCYLLRQILLPTSVNFVYNWAFFMVVNGQIMKTVKAIRSYWVWPKYRKSRPIGTAWLCSKYLSAPSMFWFWQDCQESRNK